MTDGGASRWPRFLIAARCHSLQGNAARTEEPARVHAAAARRSGNSCTLYDGHGPPACRLGRFAWRRSNARALRRFDMPQRGCAPPKHGINRRRRSCASIEPAPMRSEASTQANDAASSAFAGPAVNRREAAAPGRRLTRANNFRNHPCVAANPPRAGIRPDHAPGKARQPSPRKRRRLADRGTGGQ